MHERILIAGSGGQGVVSLGKLLARLAAETIQHVTFFPAYGAEVRGGTSNCQVILSANEIAAPIAEKFDSLLVMNQQSTDHFMPSLDENGLAIVNQSLCKVNTDACHVHRGSSRYYLPSLDKNGLASVNQSLRKVNADSRHVLVAATEIADRLGSTKAANFVMLGTWLARKPLIPARAIENAMASHFRDAPAALIDINIQAFRAGLAA